MWDVPVFRFLAAGIKSILKNGCPVANVTFITCMTQVSSLIPSETNSMTTI